MNKRTHKLAIGLAVAASLTPAAQAKPFAYAYKDKYAAVDFSWSAQAADIPALVRRFRADLAKEKARTIRCGREETDIRLRSGGGGIRCESSTKIMTSGETARLLSLARQYWAFTGGAHGNGATTALLWDRRANKEISFASLFKSSVGYSPVLRAPYCEALNQERKKRRGGNGKLDGAMFSEFDACPKFGDLAIIPAASHRKRKFDAIAIMAAPYVAGPYAEGDYEITLPVTAQLMAALKPEYRASFQTQRQ